MDCACSLSRQPVLKALRRDYGANDRYKDFDRPVAGRISSTFTVKSPENVKVGEKSANGDASIRHGAALLSVNFIPCLASRWQPPCNRKARYAVLRRSLALGEPRG